jgi:hypothetical protein
VIYWRLAAAITLGSFAAILCILSLVSALTSPAIARRLEQKGPRSRAAVLLALRLLPPIAGLFGAFGIVLPMFLWFEPSDTNEPVAITLAVAAVAGAGWLTRGAWRALSGWRATRALARAWRTRGRRLDMFDPPVPVFAIDETYPLVAVVGFRRPQLFISERVLRACPPDEVRAMILHECAHVAARDNIKRFVLRACPALLSANRGVEHLWGCAAEEAADAAAATLRPGLRTDLAHGLIRVARLATSTHRPLSASAFYLGDAIEARVRRLLEPDEPEIAFSISIRALSFGFAAVVCVSFVVFGSALHDALEAIVRFLP